MSHAYSHNLLHCVFSTKQRQDLIHKPEELWRYVAALAHARNIHVLAAGGTENHLHVLILLPTITLATAMQEIKVNSSRWLRETSAKFQWQEGDGAFSVSQSQRQAVMDYIGNQTQHHQERKFEEEFLALLKNSGVQYDPRFVFG